MDSVAVPFLLDNVPSFKFFSRRFILSNHFVHTFNINLDCYGQISVMSSEHAYFLLKATHFGDMASFHHIRYAPTPAAEKRLGRRIMPFVEQQWHAVRFEMMCRALRAKFAVEPLRRALQTSGYGPLVKASKDEYWAAGREMHEIGLTATANWLGQNALGEALMLIWEEVRTHPPTPNNLVRHYVVAQASAEDYVIVAASFDHEPFFIRVGNDMLQGLDFPRNLAVGDTLVIVSYYWRAAFERVAQIGHPTLPGWLHQGQIVRQAEAQSVQSVALVLSFIMPGVVRATNNGRHQGHRIVCSINVLVNGRVHTLAKRNMHENAIEHLEVSQNVHLHVMEVSAGWWCARNYILPPNALLGTGMEWQSEGRLKGKRKGEKEERERREWMKGKMEVEEARLKGSGKQENNARNWSLGDRFGGAEGLLRKITRKLRNQGRFLPWGGGVSRDSGLGYRLGLDGRGSSPLERPPGLPLLSDAFPSHRGQLASSPVISPTTGPLPKPTDGTEPFSGGYGPV